MLPDAAGDGTSQPLISLPPAGARDPRPGLSGLPVADLERWLGERDLPSYRARQIADHVWAGSAQSVDGDAEFSRHYQAVHKRPLHARLRFR